MSYENVTGKILIDSDKDPNTNELMCYMEIMLDDGFERHFNTDITAQQSDVLSEQILVDIALRYGRDEEVTISRFFTVKSMRDSMHGINIMNQKGSHIALNFLCRGIDFDKVVASYSNKLTEEQNNIIRIRDM